MHVASQEDALAEQEQQGHPQAAEDFEVDPECLIREGDVQIGGAAEQKEHDPGDVQFGPDGLWQGQCMAHDALDQQAITDEVTASEDQREQPVDHRRFPLEEGFAVKRQCQAAEHQTGDQRQPLAFFQFALSNEKDAIDHDGACDQHRGGAENATYHDAVAHDVDGMRVDLVNDEKQD